MTEKERLGKLRYEICTALETCDISGLGILVQLSGCEGTTFILEGDTRRVVEGLVNTAYQKEKFSKIIYEVVEILEKVKKDENSVEQLIEKSLGCKPKEDKSN